MRVLCLIIDASPIEAWRETYEVHRRVWYRCLERCPDVDGYFLHSDPDLESAYTVEGRRFTVRGEECFGTILNKTLKAVEVLLAEHDYVVRTTVTSLYDFPLLLRDHLPTKNLYAGCLVDGSYVTGSGMILSSDVARKLLLPVTQALSEWDDIAISQILSSHGVRAQHRDWFSFDYAKGLEQVSVGTHYHYRLREHGDPRRTKEREVTEYLFSRLYP